MFDELYGKQPTRKWHQLTQEEKRRELEMLCESGHYKILALLHLQQKLKQII